MVPSVYSTPFPLHAADDVESQPRPAAAIVLAQIANHIWIVAGLHEHPHDGAFVNAAVVANEKPGVRLMAILVEGLPQPGCGRLGAKRLARAEEQ